MTCERVSNTDARKAFETLRMYCRERECGSCYINHVCSQMMRGDFAHLESLCCTAEETIPQENKND